VKNKGVAAALPSRGLIGPDALRAGPVALYAQLANILRDRIASGAWKHGDEIPTLDEITRQYAVARVTARQAIQMLVGEGLLSSQRGRRTTVTVIPPDAKVGPLYSSIGAIGATSEDFSIEILVRERVAVLPPDPSLVAARGVDYWRIRKIDSQGGAPYAVSDNYIAAATFARIPAHAERREKLSRLVRDHHPGELASAHEFIAVGAPSRDEAAHLRAPPSSPVARVRRTFLDANGEVVYLGLFAYRGDRFRVERDISEFVRI
jgi:GntR family transcriptional regulator